MFQSYKCKKKVLIKENLSDFLNVVTFMSHCQKKLQTETKTHSRTIEPVQNKER